MTGPRFPIQGQEVVPPSPSTGAGQFNPYRGLDVHGVASPDVWQDVAAPDTATAVVPVYEEPPEPDPVPVYVVNRTGKERKDVRIHWEPVDNLRPVRILTQDDRRTRAKIKLNEGAGVRVWISNNENVAVWNGYPLDGGGVEFETTTQSDLWAIADAPPDPRKIIVLEEIAISI